VSRWYRDSFFRLQRLF